MSGKRFQKRKEDFICEKCDRKVIGDGYTNHCPGCLWSKHVDNFPGDRENSCHGMMEPMEVEIDHGEQYLVHCCTKCEKQKRQKVSKEDDFEAVLKVVSRGKKSPG